jgi:hypothetical protein
VLIKLYDTPNGRIWDYYIHNNKKISRQDGWKDACVHACGSMYSRMVLFKEPKKNECNPSMKRYSYLVTLLIS